jgi:hypothetical protein
MGRPVERQSSRGLRSHYITQLQFEENRNGFNTEDTEKNEDAENWESVHTPRNEPCPRYEFLQPFSVFSVLSL